MSDGKVNPRLIILSLVQPYLSTLAPVLYINSRFGESSIFPLAYPLIHFVLILSGAVLFRPYARKNLYSFEDLESGIDERLVLAILFISIGASFAVIHRQFAHFFLFIPYFTALLFLWMNMLFFPVSGNPIPGIVRLWGKHINATSHLLFWFIGAKVLLMALLALTGEPGFPPLPAAAGFCADALLLIFLRGERKRLDREEDPGGEINGLFLYILSLAVAGLIARDRSILSPYLIVRFFHWIGSLFGKLPRGTGEFSPPPVPTGPTPQEIEKMRQIAANRIADFPLLRKIAEIAGYILFGAIGLLIVVFIFYPLLAPFLSRGRKKVTFREYYKAIFSVVVSFFRKIVGAFTAWPFNKKGETLDGKDKAGSFTGFPLPPEFSSPAKKAERAALLRLYGKLRKRASRHLGRQMGNSRSVGEFFGELGRINRDWENFCLSLESLFNRAFFSPEPLSREDRKLLRNLSAGLLKAL